MRRHRTTARGAPLLLLLAALCAGVGVRRVRDRSRCSTTSRSGQADRVPGRRCGEVRRRLWRPAAERAPRGHRHRHHLALCRRRGRGRQDPTLDDLRARRLHALPVRRERNDVSVHPSQQRPHPETGQPRHMRRRSRLCGRSQGRRAGQGGPADRLQRRLRRCRGNVRISISRCTRATAPMSTRFRT